MAKRRVLITGASGEITRQLLPAFRDRYDLVLLDTGPGAHADDIIDVDVSDPDIDKYRAHFRGIDAIIHNVRAARPGVKTSNPRAGEIRLPARASAGLPPPRRLAKK